MSTIDQDVAKIRTAIYGKDVREAIADGIEKTESIVANIQQNYSGIPDRVNSLEDDVDTLDGEMADVKGDINSLKTTTSTHSSDINSLKTTTSTHSSDINSLKTTTLTHSSDINSLKTTTSTHSGDITSLKSRTSALENIKPIGADITLDTAPKISSGQNLNNYTSAGSYQIQSSAVALEVTNCPSEFAGRLIVLKSYTGSPSMQLYMDAAFDIYVRAYVQGSWTTWQKVTKIDKNNSVLTANLDEVSYTAIEANSDLNSFDTPGSYIIKNKTVAATISNLPSNNPGRLHILCTLINSGYKSQIYITNYGEIFVRHYYGGSWTKWSALIDENYLSRLLGKDTILITPSYIVNQSVGDTVSYVPETGGDVYYKHAVIDCEEGDLFCIKGYGRIAAKLWSFVNSSDTIISVAEENEHTNASYIMIKAPKNAKKLVVNFDIREGQYDIFRYSDSTAETDLFVDHFSKGIIEYGRYSSIDLSYASTSTFLCTIEDIPSYVESMRIDGNIDVAISVFNKNGTMHSSDYWHSDGFVYLFNHSLYNYRLHFTNKAHKTPLGNWDTYLNAISLICSKKKYSEDISAIMEKNKKQQKEINSLEAYIYNMKINMPYNISFANAHKAVDLYSYAGDTQNVHPKVLYFENGFGGYKYWMAYTPYPTGNDAAENPCIAYSNDGIKWTNYDNNPLSDPGGNGYNSDTHLIYKNDTGVLECWYRYVGPSSQSPREETIKKRTTSNGITWTSEETVYSNLSGDYARLLSPAIIIENNKYCIWVVDRNVIKYYEAPVNDQSNWTLIRTFDSIDWSVDGVNGLKPWHLDVIKTNGEYVICAMCRNGTVASSDWRLMITKSSDNITYSSPYTVIKGSNGWDAKLYRSSIVNIGAGYRIYYSALDGSGAEDHASQGATWGLGITESKTLTNFIGMLY